MHQDQLSYNPEDTKVMLFNHNEAHTPEKQVGYDWPRMDLTQQSMDTGFFNLNNLQEQLRCPPLIVLMLKLFIEKGGYPLLGTVYLLHSSRIHNVPKYRALLSQQ